MGGKQQTFQVQVSAPPGARGTVQHVASHRYNDFATLHEHMREQKDKFDKLPPMPPKSFFRRHVFAWLVSSYFVDQRQAGLEALIKAMVELDPQLGDVELRKFLGVMADGSLDL